MWSFYLIIFKLAYAFLMVQSDPKFSPHPAHFQIQTNFKLFGELRRTETFAKIDSVSFLLCIFAVSSQQTSASVFEPPAAWFDLKLCQYHPSHVVFIPTPHIFDILIFWYFMSIWRSNFCAIFLVLAKIWYLMIYKESVKTVELIFFNF